jgi:nicotinamidase-related amidase
MPSMTGLPRRPALVAVDLLTTFAHPDGDRLLASMRQRIDGIERTIADARRSGWPIVYLNDNWGSGTGTDHASSATRSTAGAGVSR